MARNWSTERALYESTKKGGISAGANIFHKIGNILPFFHTVHICISVHLFPVERLQVHLRREGCSALLEACPVAKWKGCVSVRVPTSPAQGRKCKHF
ncbi:hypothetical protein POVWA2_059060 [Plasmodium ovale wallikeri]|uniref:Uncharacterized protein n=1 Tax=Plasmodium ovale wallikeri TaxID=864142 RepID=A0A1A9A068_PLAOA|nr:hypothetical protein POVWA1_059720 [Plasmodium ovale wallikeri]SBT49903.1 hypothetical protein POVWA2_059060 [Plasmodium ovale wallikeri]